MTQADNPRLTTLLYRSVASMAACDTPTQIEWDDYYSVLQYPAAEVGADCEEIASEFIALTYAPAWQWALRRQVRPGDLIVLPPAAYMFIDPVHRQLFPSEPIPLRQWRHLALIPFELQGAPCKAST